MLLDKIVAHTNLKAMNITPPIVKYKHKRSSTPPAGFTRAQKKQNRHIHSTLYIQTAKK